MPERRDGHRSRARRDLPSSLPRALGIQIDHVFVPSGSTTSRFEVMDVAGSDHRAVLAQVRLPVL
jgi:endonuclease/exonuclease/phosphatase (EEP) superfamily protein YafD